MALISDPDVDLISLSRTTDITNPRRVQSSDAHATDTKTRIGTTVKVTGTPTSDWMKICEGAAVSGSEDRKSTRLNSSHVAISYAVFCLKKKNKHTKNNIYTL